MEEVVKRFEDFLISCVDVGTAPCWAIPSLVEAKQWVEKASADPIRAVKQTSVQSCGDSSEKSHAFCHEEVTHNCPSAPEGFEFV